MKKLIIVLLSVLFLTSCYTDINETVKEPKKQTTVKLQELTKDTVTISIEGSNLYVFDENNVLIYKAKGLNENTQVSIHHVYIIITSILSLILIIGFIWETIKSN